MNQEPNDHEYRKVLELPAEKRMIHCFKRCVDLNAVCLAEDAEGWITLKYEGGEFLPVWPARRYAEACLPASEWPGVNYQRVELEDWLETTLPKLEENSIDIAVLGTPQGDVRVLTASETRDAFEAELNTRLFRSPNWDPEAEEIDLMELLKPALKASMKAKPKGKLP